MVTYQPKGSDIKHDWHLLSAKGWVLGRLATHIARLLMGKQKRSYVPHLDAGDWVVVTDAKEIVVTGRKAQQKVYRRYSGYPGGLHEIPFATMMHQHPQRIIEYAVRGMLPDNRLKSRRLARLKVFSGPQHPYGDKFGIKNEASKKTEA